jgi:DNA-binding NarL/FixJ family response regulator
VPAERRLGAAQPYCVHLDELITLSSGGSGGPIGVPCLSGGREPGVRMSWEESGTETKVLIVDDHDLFRTGLRALVEEGGFAATDAASGAAALRRVAQFRPDVVVMDLNMPGMSGIEATRQLLQLRPEAAVLILTISNDDARVIEAVRAGARGYLLKDAPLEEILTGIRAAAAGHTMIAPRIAGALFAHVRATEDASPSAVPPRAPDLSDREREVLELVGEGYDNAEIAQRLYLSQSTVKNHVSKLLEKLGAENRVQAAVYGIRRGLVQGDGQRASSG